MIETTFILRTTRRTLLGLAIAACGSSPFALANLVRNGAFNEPGAVTSPQPPLTRPDNRIPSWTMSAEWYIDQAATPPFKQAQVIRIDGGNEHRQLSQQVYLEPGKRYTLSAWVKGNNLSQTSPDLKDNQTGILVTNFRWTEKHVLPLHNIEGSDWQRCHVTFTAPQETLVGGVAQPCLVRIFTPKGETGTLWVSGIQIEEGDEVGDFEFISSLQRRDAAEKVEKMAAALDIVGNHLSQFEGASLKEFTNEVEAVRGSLGRMRSQVEAHEKSAPERWMQLEAELVKTGETARRTLNPFAWWHNAWDNIPVRALPSKTADIDRREVEITRAVNDYGALLLPVANLTNETIPVEVKVGEETAPLSTQSPFNGPIKVSTCFWVSNEGYVSTLSPVKEHQSFPYFLQALPSSNTTLLPANETTQLWFDVDTRGMKPGTYRYPVKLIGLNREYSWEGSIVLKVLPVALPEKVPTNVMTYANMPFYMEPFNPHSAKQPILELTPEQRLAMARPWLSTWREMGFNRLMLTNHFLNYKFDKQGNLAAPVDYAALDAYHELWKEITDKYWAGWNLAAYHIYGKNWRDTAKAKFNEVERTRTEAVLKSFTEHAESVGISREDMVLCLFDEPHGKRIDITRQGREALQKVAPGWRTLAAIAGTDRSHVEALMPLLDIFAVRQRMGQMDMKPDTIEYLKKNGKEVWGYACSGSFEYLHPYRYFRLLPWQAWSNGLNGYALYMNILHLEYPKIGARSSFFSPLFLGKDGPVYGRGARGFQLGGRDWALFDMARNLLAKKRAPGVDTSTLETLLNQSLRHVVEDDGDAALADEVRGQILLEIERLQSTNAAP